MIRAIALVSLIAFALEGALGQPSSGFEVASVRSNKSKDLRGMSWRFLPGGGVTSRNLPLYIIIATAYNIPMYSKRLSGGPGWIYSEKYDIDAKATSDAIDPISSAKVRHDAGRAMLQSLLAERFKLTVRRDTKEMPAYSAAVVKNGLRLARSKIDERDCPEAGPNYGGS